MKKFLKSIRFQIIFFYLLVLTSTLTIFSLFLYLDYSNTLNDKVDSVLRLKANGIEESVRTYWQAGRLEMSKDWSDAYLFHTNEDQEFKKIADQLTMENLSKERDIPTITFIFDNRGNLIASSGRSLIFRHCRKRPF